MYNHYLLRSIALTAICFLFLTNGSSAQNNDEPGLTTPKYSNVDVRVEYDWGDEEYFEQVKVFDCTEREEPCIIIVPQEGGRKEIRIFKGVTIRIYDHQTKKLLDVYES